jgi:tetratricopeptide (TPR) repeat protein
MELIEKEPLWHCRDFLVGESAPDLLAKGSVIALSLSIDRMVLADGKKVLEDITLPENPEFEDAERLFWKMNMHMAHMGISPYIEDVESLELTVSDIDNLTHMLSVAKELEGFKNAADEETLSRFSVLYFHAHRMLDYLHGVEPKAIKNGKKELYSYVSRYTSMAEKIIPQKGIAEVNRGFLDMRLGRYKDAIAHFKRVRDFEKKPRVLTNIGMAFENMDMHEEADEYYVKALKMDGRYAKAWMGRARVALAMKKWGAALQFVSRAIEIEPKNPDAHILEGDIFMQQGLTSEAEKSYEKASKLRWGERALLKRAALMYENGRWGAALQFIERYLFIVPNDHEGWVMKARILKENGDSEGARSAYERALEIKSTPEIGEEMRAL